MSASIEKARINGAISVLRSLGNKAMQTGDWDYAVYIGQLINQYIKHKERIA